MRLIDAGELLKLVDPDEYYHSNEVRDMIDLVPTVAFPPNAPLTLDELREMDGEPVFVAMRAFACSGYWGIVHNGWIRFGDGDSVPIEKNVGCTYRRKPEEGTIG